MATVRKRTWTHKGASREAWVVTYSDGAGARRLKTFDKKRDADAYRTRVESELSEGNHVAVSKANTVATVAQRYIEHNERRMRDGDIGRARFVAIESAIRLHVVSALGGLPYADLTPEKVERWYDGLKPGLSVRTRRMYLTEFNGLDAFAVRRRFARRASVKEFRDTGLRGQSVRAITSFAMGDVRALLSALQEKPHYGKERAWERLRIVVHLALFCGLRRGEIYGLTPASLDFDRGIIRVRHSLTAWGVLKSPKTKSGERDVPMPDHVADLLTDWLRRRYRPNPLDLLLTATRGGNATTGAVDLVKGHQKAWRALLIRAGLHDAATPTGPGLHFHALRHFASSWQLAQGQSPSDVARLLGHKSFDMTLQVYAHPVYDESHRVSAFNAASTRLIALAAPDVDATTARQDPLVR